MKVNLDDLKDKFIGQTFGWLTIIDAFRDESKHQLMFTCVCKCGTTKNISKSNLLSGRVNSCGCYQHTVECKEKQYAWHKDDKKVKLHREKCKEWCKNNRHKVNEIASKNKQLRKEFPERFSAGAENIKQSHRNNRLKCDFSILRDYVCDDTYTKLCSGEISTKDTLALRCPSCNREHLCSLHNVFLIRKNTLRGNGIPLCSNCRNTLTSSKYEDEIASYISEFYFGKCVRNSRDIISPLELDLYYPEKNIAIEFNGDYWHSDEFKPKDYHFNKFTFCRDNGILLVSIFESKWINYNNTIKKYLYDLFNDKENEISFADNMTLMNNNYQSKRYYQFIGEHIDGYEDYRTHRIYHCGYSKIVTI